jgi:peptidoglycan/LPS O-acetylase OafA/YrhL
MNASVGVSPHDQQRLTGLDSLRGLAAMAVVLFHYTTGYQKFFGSSASAPLFYLPSGCFGVQLFFCISGFVILRTLERTSDIKSFAISRFARLYPAYFVCALITLATIALSHVHLSDLNAEAIAINATMLALLTGAPRIDPSYWTLTYEVLFYAAAALIWFRLRPGRRVELPCLIWLACSLIGHLVDGIHRHSRLAVLMNIDYANLFVLGMMLHYLSKGSRSRLTLPTFCAALLLSLFPPVDSGAGVSLFRVKFTFMIAVFCALIWLAADDRRRFLHFRPLVFLGEISYSLYLIHQIAGYAVIRILLRAGMEIDGALLVTIAFVIGLAACLRVFVEKPAERWIKNFAKPARRQSLLPQSAAASGGG